MSSHTYASPFEKDMYVIEQCGHHLEWLVEYFPPSTPRADILSPLVQELCCSLERCQNMQLKRHGAVYHGLRALRIYAEKLRDSEEVLPHTNREMSRCSTEDVFSH